MTAHMATVSDLTQGSLVWCQPMQRTARETLFAACDHSCAQIFVGRFAMVGFMSACIWEVSVPLHSERPCYCSAHAQLL